MTAATSPPASATPAKSTAITPAENALPLGAASAPAISSPTGQLIGASNASGLFPAIVPSSTPDPSPGLHPQASTGITQPVADSSAFGQGSPALTGQVAGLVALALGVLLTVTRLSLRKRARSPKQGG
ncbi:MAG: hypothetical protein WAK82_06875 [Streptosporangiaceae bacterium]